MNNEDPNAKSNKAKLAALREALIKGENSGPSTPFDFDAFLARMNAQSRAKKKRGRHV
jgi:antitoxin ParD1/3/4